MAKTYTKMIRIKPRLIRISGRIRWLHTIVVLATIVMVFTTLLRVASLEDKSSSFNDDKSHLIDATTGKTKTKRVLATEARCTDDPNFRYKGGKSCKWVGKKRKKRCRKKKRSKRIEQWCKQTCDYNNCNTMREELSVGVYYYPWWGGDFHRGNPDDPDLYLRRQLTNPQQLPELGEYDDREPSIIARHLEWSHEYNINLWVTSWWGKDKREDVNIKENILTHPQIHDLKVAIFYETTNRIRERDDYSLENVKSDLQYLCQEYFHHESYFRMGVDDEGHAESTSPNTRPVLYVYLTRKLERENVLSEAIRLMREGAKEAGCGEIFIVGDQVFQAPPSAEMDIIPFELLDAVTNYDVYGSMRGGKNMGYVGSREQVTEYYEEQNHWRAQAHAQNCAFIPCVSPGFNDRGVRPEKGRIPLSRRLNKDSPEGSLFEAALQEARKIVDPNMGNLIMVNSWNEWHEDTQIEPCVPISDATTDGTWPTSTNLPMNLTYGLEYEAYESKYLRILKAETDSWDSSMRVPVPNSIVVQQSTGATTEERDEEDIVTISDIIGWELNRYDGGIEQTIAV